MTRRNLELYRGDTFPFVVTVTNAGVAVNIDGFQFRMTAKYAIQDADINAVFTIVSPTDIVITDAVNGKLLVTIPPSATLILEPRVYRLQYDIQMYNDPQTIYTICSGILLVTPDCSVTTP